MIMEWCLDERSIQILVARLDLFAMKYGKSVIILVAMCIIMMVACALPDRK